MNKLIFNFTCLDGAYSLEMNFEENKYIINTTIPYFESKEGSFEKDDIVELLNKANIKSWDEEYLDNNNSIEDACMWEVNIIDGNKKYGSKGHESFEPYNYEYLIQAIKLVEPKADFFSVNI